MKRTGFIVAIILGLLVATSVFADSDYERYTQPAAIILDLTESEAASVIEEKISCVVVRYLLWKSCVYELL